MRARRRTWGWRAALVIGALAAALVLAAAGGGWPGPFVGESPSLSVTPSTISVWGHPVQAYVGSYDVDRAVIQVVAVPMGGGGASLTFIDAATLESAQGSFPATLTRSSLRDGTAALTLEFRAPRVIGRSVLVLRSGQTQHTFDVQWPNQ